MALYWNRNLYSIGIDWVDNQHESFFNAVERLQTAYESGITESEVFQLVDFLEEYAIQHFRDEEQLMADYHYEGLAQQQKEHRNFIQKVAEFKAKLVEDEVPIQRAIEIYSFAVQWIIEHISTLDREMGEKVKNLSDQNKA